MNLEPEFEMCRLQIKWPDLEALSCCMALRSGPNCICVRDTLLQGAHPSRYMEKSKNVAKMWTVFGPQNRLWTNPNHMSRHSGPYNFMYAAV